MLQLPASEAAVLEGIIDDLSAVGFDLSNLGGGSYAINGVPAGIEGLNPVELVRSMLHTAMEKGSDVKEEVQSILRSEEHTSELQSRQYLVCRLLLEKKKT